MYRLGCCVSTGSFMPQVDGSAPSNVDTITQNCKYILSCGFDYTELSVSAVVSLSDGEIAALASRDLKIEAANSFIPAQFSIIEGGEELREYVGEAMRKSAALGIKVIVFGSGKARMMPEKATEEEKLTAVKDFLRMCNTYAQKYGITVVIEPLEYAECNYINKVTEAAKIARALKLSNIRSLADSFHMGQENEPFSALTEAEDQLAHIHVAEKTVRTYPGKENDEAFLPEMARVLKATTYNGRISVECKFSDEVTEAPLAYEYLRKIFNE